MTRKLAGLQSLSYLVVATSFLAGVSAADLPTDRSEVKTCKTIGAQVKGLSIHLKGADVLMRHEERSDIVIKSNYPEHYEVDSTGKVVQTKATVCPAGVFTNANGKTVIRGKTIQVHGDKAIIDGKEYDTIANTTPSTTSAQRSSISVSADGILINGKKIEEGPVDPSNPDRPEVLQIMVPNTFEGNLSIVADIPPLSGGIQSESLRLDSWSGPLSVDGVNAEVDVRRLNSKQHVIASVFSNNHLRIGQSLSNDANFSADGPGANIAIDILKAETVQLKSTNLSSIEVKSGSTNVCKTESVNGRINLDASFSTSDPG